MEQPGPLRLQEGLLLRLRQLFIDLRPNPSAAGQHGSAAAWQLVARRNSTQLMQAFRHGTAHLLSGQVDMGLVYLRRGFDRVDSALESLGAFDLFSLLFARASWSEAGITTAFWRYVAAMAGISPRYAPMGGLFRFVCKIVQKEGAGQFSQLLVLCRGRAAEILDEVYGSTNPQVLSAWRILMQDAGFKDPHCIDRPLAVLLFTFTAVGARFGYSSSVSMQTRKWYFTLKDLAGRAAKNETLEQING